MATLWLCFVTIVLAVVDLTHAAPPSLIVTSKKGIFHLDADGKLLNYRNESDFRGWQKGHVATNPRNGTVCWVARPPERKDTGVIRCAPVKDLDASWELPQPENFRILFTEKMEIDPDSGNFYMTISGTSYVCTPDFQHCAKLQEKTDSVRTLIAYDIPNRLMFFITYEDYSVKPPRKSYIMEAVSLDGSGRRQIAGNDTIFFPSAMDVDRVEKKIYTLDRTTIYHRELYQMNYDGGDVRLVTKFERQLGATNKRDMKVVGDSIYVLWGNQQNISRVDKNTGDVTHLVNGKLTSLDGTTEIELEKEDLLSLNVYSEDLLPSAENSCLKSRGGCGDICVPTVTAGAQTHTCFCPPGQELVDTGCFDREPGFIIAVHRDSLRAINLASDESSTILTGLSNASKVDFLYSGKHDYILYWIDNGGLFRGRWQPGKEVDNVETLVPAGGTSQVVDVAVDWNQENVLWAEYDAEADDEDSAFTVKVASVYGTAQKTILEEPWLDQTALFIHNEGVYFSFQQTLNDSERGFQEWSMDGKNATFMFAFDRVNPFRTTFKIREFVADRSAVSDVTDDRYFWVDPDNATIGVTFTDYLPIIYGRRTLLQHDSLRNSLGMDVLHNQIFWVDGSAGVLMTANSRTGDDIRPLETAEYRDPDFWKNVRSIKILHPRKQPPGKREDVCGEDRAGCSEICLKMYEDSERFSKCACDDEKVLAEDGKTCE